MYLRINNKNSKSKYKYVARNLLNIEDDLIFFILLRTITHANIYIDRWDRHANWNYVCIVCNWIKEQISVSTISIGWWTVILKIRSSLTIFIPLQGFRVKLTWNDDILKQKLFSNLLQIDFERADIRRVVGAKNETTYRISMRFIQYTIEYDIHFWLFRY